MSLFNGCYLFARGARTVEFDGVCPLQYELYCPESGVFALLILQIFGISLSIVEDISCLKNVFSAAEIIEVQYLPIKV